MKTKDQFELVNIGRISSAVGLKGEVRATLYSRDSENLKEGKNLLLVRAKEKIEAVCEKARYQNDKLVVKFEGIDDRTQAEFLKGMEIYLSEDQLDELPEGEHYVRDIVGYSVFDVASKSEVGKLTDVLQNTAQSLLEVKTADGKQVLIPAVSAFLKQIDDEREVIEVELIPGFLD